MTITVITHFLYYTLANITIQIIQNSLCTVLFPDRWWVTTCLFKGHPLVQQQREDSRPTLRLTGLTHEAHAEAEVIFIWQVDSRTGHLRAVQGHYISQIQLWPVWLLPVAFLTGCQLRVVNVAHYWRPLLIRSSNHSCLQFTLHSYLISFWCCLNVGKL